MGKIALRIKNWIKQNPKEAIFLGVILLVGAFLRLYRISEYMTFLGDEGRDVIIVRRLLVYLDPILIGPGTSIGNMYLGPLYYYMMAPALALAGLSPVGPAVQVALLGVATVFFVWYIARKWFGRWGALIASSLYAISPTIIIYSRSSWNPNIMPFFALLSIWGTWKFWQEGKWKWLIIVGIALAFTLQSHYLALLLFSVVGFFWLLTYLKVRKTGDAKKFLLNSVFAGIIFLILMSPLVIFDARHGWRNFAAMRTFFTERQTTVSARPWNAIPKIPKLSQSITTRVLSGKNETAGRFTLAAILILSLTVFVKRKSLDRKSKAAFLLISVWILVALIGLGNYKQEIYDHYFGFFFAAPFLLLGGLVEEALRIDRKRFFKATIFFGILMLVLANLAENPLKYPPNNQMVRSRVVADKIIEEAREERFNLAVLAERNYDDGYQYFLEIKGVPVIDIDPQVADETTTNQLFVVCELPKEKCDPTHSPKAEVANFGWSGIEEEWDLSGITLYKLVHTK